MNLPEMNFTGTATVFFGDNRCLLSYDDVSTLYEIAETADLLLYENNLEIVNIKRVWHGGVKEYIKKAGEPLREGRSDERNHEQV